MRIVRTGFELRMELRADEPRMILDLDYLDETVIRQCAGNHHARLRELLPIDVVELIAVAMALMDELHAIGRRRIRPQAHLARISTQAHRAALFLDIDLRAHEVDDRMRGLGVELGAVGIAHAADVARELDNRALHAQAQPQEWKLVLPRILDRANLPLDPAIADEIRKALARSIKVNARPLTAAEWTALLTEAGLEVEWVGRAATALLQMRRNLADEGVHGVLRIAWNLVRNPGARRRVLSVRRTFTRYADQLTGIALVARKPA